MSSPQAAPLLEVEEIHTYYGKSHILDGVSFQVGKGEVVGLLGRNGVGKSTTSALEDSRQSRAVNGKERRT